MEGVWKAEFGLLWIFYTPDMKWLSASSVAAVSACLYLILVRVLIAYGHILSFLDQRVNFKTESILFLSKKATPPPQH